MRAFLVESESNDDLKCIKCHDSKFTMTVLADSQEEADQLYKSGKAGLCDWCFIEMMVNEGIEINFKKVGQM